MLPDAWDRLLATNVTGQWHVARAALPMMAASGTIRAVFLTSEAGWAFTPGVGPYNVSKAALNSLGASLAAETAARHPGADVQINLLDPGEARTEMNQGSTASPYAAVPMALALLTHPPGGPNGRFFHRDGRHRAFAYAGPWPRSLLDDAMVGDPSTAAGGSRDRQGIGPIRLLATGLWRKLRHD
jgi:NAD(P)-dependent dehydrogenase (short-subunit alcohol dehydrogenase family)